MNNVFEIVDKTGRKIRLTKERWKHINLRHPYMTNYLKEVEETIKSPQKIISHDMGDLFDYYNYFKHKKGKLKFLKAVVKYLNGKGFILSAYFVTHIN
nr:hypothetical protein [Candidatus Woesearchaeota archaeon]